MICIRSTFAFLITLFGFYECFQYEGILNVNNLTNPYSIKLDKLNTFDLKFNTRIIGGVAAQPYQLPYQTANYIFGESGRILFCGGALISEKFVISAAHCIFEKPKRILIIMGNTKLLSYTRNELRADTDRYIIHKKYNSKTLRHDICLLQLHKKVVFNKAIRPIAIPNIADIHKNYINKLATLSGFGKTVDGGELSRQLMYIRLRIMDNDLCNEYFNDREAEYTNICTSGEDDQGACQGDSGGPLVIDNKLIGLVSFGARYCSLGYPSVHTRVPSYVRWLANYTNIPLH